MASERTENPVTQQAHRACFTSQSGHLVTEMTITVSPLQGQLCHPFPWKTNPTQLGSFRKSSIARGRAEASGK